MNAVDPTLAAEESCRIEVEGDVAHDGSLPAVIDRHGLVVTEWALTPNGFAALMCGGRVRVWTHTHGEAFQPVYLEVVIPDDVGVTQES